jgi:hypothetical protein
MADWCHRYAIIRRRGAPGGDAGCRVSLPVGVARRPISTMFRAGSGHWLCLALVINASRPCSVKENIGGREQFLLFSSLSWFRIDPFTIHVLLGKVR